MPAEGARARHRVEEAEHVAGDGVKPRAARAFPLDIGEQGRERVLRGRERRRRAEQQRVDGEKPPRLAVGRPPHHDAVDATKLRARRFEAFDAAIEHDRKLRMRALEAMHALVIERGDLAVLPGREAFEPCLARVHDERVDAGLADRAGERVERLLRILIVDADAALDRDRQRHRRPHGGDAVADQCRLRHQAGAEAALLHPVRRAAEIEIDFVVAEVLRDARALRERARIAAAELERHRMLRRIEGEEPRAVAVDHRAGRHHLGVDERAPGEQAMEEPAVPVGPFHHRGDAELAVRNIHFIVFSSTVGPGSDRSGRTIRTPSIAQGDFHLITSDCHRWLRFAKTAGKDRCHRRGLQVGVVIRPDGVSF